MTPLIRARGLRKLYRLPAETIAAVDGVDLDIAQGEFISLMGPSGSGKTTLLDVLGCLDGASEGSLAVFGQEVSTMGEKALVSVRRQGIAFVFQEFLLIPTLTAAENVALPLCFAGRKPDPERVREALARVGLEHRTGHLPRQLAGGDRQRVAVARALATGPRILFADEPTGNLDSRNARAVFDMLRELNERDGLTIVAATHSPELGENARRRLRLRDGKVVSDSGAPSP